MGTPSEFLEEDELMRLVLPTLRADLRVVERYTHIPSAPLRCPVTAFAGAGDSLVEPQELEAWSRHTRAGFRLRVVPGGHFFLESSETLVLSEIGDALAEAGAEACT
jgi:surfactin synthase thioesterase subunit